MVDSFQEDNKLFCASSSKMDFFRHIYTYWSGIPPDVRHLLLTSSVGERHLLQTHDRLMVHAKTDQHLLELAVDLLWARWEADPLDPELASKIMTLEHSKLTSFFQLEQLVKAIRFHWDRPIRFEEGAPYETLLADFSDLVEQISSLFPPWSLGWWKYLKVYAQFYNALDWFERLVELRPWQRPLRIIQQRILLDIAVIRGKYGLARKILSSEIPFSEAMKLIYLGKLAFLEGDLDKSVNLWRRSLIMRPWNTSIILRLYDVLNGIDSRKTFPEGKISICLYSYNKKNQLNKTIQALVESDLRDSTMLVLVNGSTDGSLEMVRNWQERLGMDRLEIIVTPVNIGAPAARNWLMHHPVVQSSDWIAYLDDDAIVQGDWLYRFGTAIALYPDAGVYGCKIVDAGSHYVVQCVDHHLQKPPEFKYTSGNDFYCSIVGHYGEVDLGDFDYIRPCIQVSGCCHMFKVKTLYECGGFDLRFSPSQHDDLDHNFREALMKRLPVYTGYLTVRHMNITGKQQLMNKAQRGNEHGNRLKLYSKYLGKPFRDMLTWEMKVLWDDLTKKIKFIADCLDGR